MGLYIKDILLPEDPNEFIEFAVKGNGAVFVVGEHYWPDAVEVPEPHGRLIDASETVRVQMYDEEHEDWYTEEMTIDDLLGQGWIDAEAPTVIPASEEE